MMLIHDMIAWPEIITENLWPFAIQYSIDIHNTPPSSGLPSLEIFSGTKDSDHLKNFHTFDCPIYVLEPTLHQNHKILRWKPHYRVGIFSGLSPPHASSVTLALSTKLGLVSPQFHLVFDGNFTTTSSLRTNQVPTNWPQLFNKSSTFYVDSDFSQKNLQFLIFLHFITSEGAFSFINQWWFSTSERAFSFIKQWYYKLIYQSEWAQFNWQLYFSRPFYLHWNIVFLINQSSYPSSGMEFTPSIQLMTFILSSHQHVINLHSSCLNPSMLKYVLHHGELQNDPDHNLFEQDMKREISYLFSTNTVEIVSKSSVPSGVFVIRELLFGVLSSTKHASVPMVECR